jgi:predicted nucleic acid-binding protein
VSLLYLDSSSLVKLWIREPETEAMLDLLRDRPELATSALSRVEVMRVLRRARRPSLVLEKAQEALAGVSMIGVDGPILEAAAGLEPMSLRSLDAVHLVTALSLQPELDAMVCHDKRLITAGRQAGLEVLAPR